MARLAAVPVGRGANACLDISPRSATFGNEWSPSFGDSKCESNGFVADLPRLPGVFAEDCLDNLLTLSWLTVLFLLCDSPSHPLWPKLPLRISIREGACARTVPVACHIPEGGLDSRNLREALRFRSGCEEFAVDDRVRVAILPAPVAGDVGVWIRVGDLAPLPPWVAMLPDERCCVYSDWFTMAMNAARSSRL